MLYSVNVANSQYCTISALEGQATIGLPPPISQAYQSTYSNTIIIKYLNPQRAGTELTRFNYVNIMVADALAPCVARTLAAMVLIIQNRQVIVLLEEEFQLTVSY